MSTHYIYEGKEYATLAEVRRAVNKSFPKNPDTDMLLLLNIETVERPDPVPQEPTEEEKAAAALEQAKQERASTVEKIKVTIDGMVFDGDEVSQGRMARTVAAAVAKGVDLKTTKRLWVLANDTPAEVTIDQLSRALEAAGDAQSAVWAKPYEARAKA